MYSVMLAGDKEFCSMIRACPALNPINGAVFSEKCSLKEAAAELEKSPSDLLIYDLETTGDEGMELLRQCSAGKSSSCVIVVDNGLSFQRARQAVLLNAFDYLMKPLDSSTLNDSVCRALTAIDRAKNSDSISAIKKKLAAAVLSGKAETEIPSVYGLFSQNHSPDRTETAAILLDIAVYVRDFCCEKYGWLINFIGDFELFKGDISAAGSLKGQLEHFERYIDGISDAMKTLYLFSEKKPLIENTVAYILAHSDEKITQNDVAKACFVNKSYLSHVFKLETRISFVDYISAVKIARAKKIICEEDLMIFEAAKKLGFDDADYFCRKFKAVTGLTPKSYRDKMKYSMYK
ncbi:MAG: helix-turn-helix domain-containing protein [Ruminiclostridium sp.]